MNSHSFHETILAFSSKKILVIGDFILDVYLKGFSNRLSPEAPVPVVDVTDEAYIPGGAGNVACNLRAMGCSVTLCSVVGDDGNGAMAFQLLEEQEINTETLIRSEHRKTVSKTRVLAGHQVITRFDTGTVTSLDDVSEHMLIDYLTLVYQNCDAVLVSDYDKGIISENVLNAIIRLQSRWPKFIAVDSKRLRFFRKLHPYLVKPNYDEIVHLLDIPRQQENRIKQLQQCGSRIYDETNADVVAVTLDVDGSAVFELGQFIHKTVAPSITSPNVSGAGDTYLSAFLLAYLVTADCKVSAEMANAASSIAVRKRDTSLCSLTELRNYFGMVDKLIQTEKELKQLCDQYHNAGKRIVFTNGCFDILHSGHVTYLHCAKELGDILILGVNKDESIKRLKGESRPINPLSDRVQVLSALTSVDHVFAFGSKEDDTPVPVIKIVKPHVFVKGGDYTKDKLPEANAIESFGGSIVFLPHIPDHSTTSIIRRISTTATSDQALVINKQK